MGSRNLIFLSGGGMQPSAILATWPGARFIARARISAERSEINPLFAGSLAGVDGGATVWGLAVETQDQVEGEIRRGVTDDGRPIDLVLAELPLAAGEAEPVVSAALYWELTPSYTSLLRQAAGIAEPEAEGGWESPLLEAESPAAGS